MELGFSLVKGEATDSNLLNGYAFLLGFGFELQFELAANEAMISMTLGTGHHSGV